MRTWLTRALVAAIVTLAIVAAAAAVWLHEPTAPVRRAAPAGGGHVRKPSDCARRQLALSIEVLGGSATVVLRHVRGAPCRLRRVPVRVTVADRAGRRVRLSATERAVAGTFSPGFERLLDITFLPSCAARGPYSALATVGPYSARGTVSTREIGCFRGG